MQAHTGALEQLATSTYQRNFNHIFVSIPIYDGSDREGFFPWLEHLFRGSMLLQWKKY